mmetsp:Transcript_28670/g.92474  ORF Transcript_28670/g.92474 Transcript_28670/m.92474 type:complete len:157 (+) Transcript_28670:170-640(+)
MIRLGALTALLLTLLPYSLAFSHAGGWSSLRSPFSRSARGGASKHEVLVPRLRSPPRAASSLTSPSMSAVDASAANLLAEQIFGQVALGGVGIILSGLVGVFVVASLVNLEDVEEDFQTAMNKKSVESEKKDLPVPDIVDLDISYDSEVNSSKDEK